MLDYFMQQKEIKKNMTKEEKERIKADKKIIDDEYGWANIDGRREKIGNFRVEPPGLFRGRGDHPKTGKLKVSRPNIASADNSLSRFIASRNARASDHQYRRKRQGPSTA